MHGKAVLPSRTPVRQPLAAVVVLACFAVVCTSLFVNTAAAQTFSFHLDDVSKVYDRLYPVRTAVAVWDSVQYDFDEVVIGNQNFRIANFLPTPAPREQTLYDYAMLDSVRVTFVYPVTYSLRTQLRDEGAIRVPVPRDFDVPNLRITFQTMDEVAEEIRVSSLRDAWRDAAYASITSQVRTTTGRPSRGGVTINIPVPMPKTLESIFGPSDKTHINLTGRASITFAGETRVVDPFIGVEGRQSQSLFPSLDMKQELDVLLTGTIGDKVNIQINHSSQAFDDNANRINVNYTGYDDDVIKLIELGNTSLSLPGSQLVSFSTQSKGLFGVKVLAQMGSTDMTFIASKQEGETSNANFSPTGGGIGAAEQRFIRDLDYVKGRYFYLDHPMVFTGANDSLPMDVYRLVSPQELAADPSLIARRGKAFVDRAGYGLDIASGMAALTDPNDIDDADQWIRLVPAVDYGFITDTNNDFVGVALARSIGDSRLAVTYTSNAGVRIGGVYSDYRTTGSATANYLVLEQIWDGTSKLASDWTWGYMLRHIYNLGLTNIDGSTFNLDITDNLTLRDDATRPVGSSEPYIRIFGLDQRNAQGDTIPDSRIDIDPNVIDLNSGFLFFPATIIIMPNQVTAVGEVTRIDVPTTNDLRIPLNAFAPDSVNVRAWTDSAFSFTGQYQDQFDDSRRIYTTDLSSADEQTAHQYVIAVSAVSTGKTFRLDAFNIIENSEVVRVDGRQLTRGSDYDIVYETGEITLKGSALDSLNPESKISIDYEFKPLGGGASSNLIGFNAISRHGNMVFGATWLYESKSSAQENPRIGEEPSRAMVGGLNASIQHQSKFLTRMINKLPLVDTDAPSSITANGEVAVSIPDPNTKGEVWLEDFEGVEDSDRFSLIRRRWYPASPPRVPDGGAGVPQSDTSFSYVWYNLEPELALTKQDLNPDIQREEDSSIQALDIEIPSLPAPGDTSAWVGVMSGFGGGGLDLREGQFIEIWVNDFKQDQLLRGGKLRIDLGVIDEDFFEPSLNKWNDEDSGRDGFAAAFDDTGLDGDFNEDEPGFDLVNAPDPNQDDLDLSRQNGKFTKRVNGTEFNRAYDSEDLDGNAQLDQLDVYFSFEIDLSDTAEVDIYRDFPDYEVFGKPDDYHHLDAWRKYRVRLTNSNTVAGLGAEPRLDQVRHMRIWFNDLRSVFPDSAIASTSFNSGLKTGHRIQISEFKIQGNRWVIDGVRDPQDELVDSLVVATDITLGVISNKTDPGVYFPPYRPTVDPSGVEDKESSLALVYDSLAVGNSARIRKQFAGNGLDLGQYRDLHFWINSNQVDQGLEYYFRIATNENAWYEVTVPLTSRYFPPGGGWHRSSVLMADMTNLKFDMPDSLGITSGTAVDITDDTFDYPIRFKGNPSLFSVRTLYAGVRNVNPDTLGVQALTGRVWMDDIYLGDVRRDIDSAQRVAFSMNLGGGVISLGGSWSRTGPDFRSLRQTRGSGSLNESYALNAKTSLQHFIPLGGFQIPLGGNYSRSTSLPKFQPSSDIEIDSEAVRDSLRTVRVNYSLNTSLQKRSSSNVLLKYSIDKMTTNFSYAKSMGSAPSARDTTTNMSGTLGYTINWATGKEVGIPWTKAKFRWWLNQLTFRSSGTRRTTTRWRFLNGEFKEDPFSFAATLTNSGSANYQPFKSLSSNMSFTINRDVGLPHEWMGINIGREVGRTHAFRVNWKPTFFYLRILNPDIDVSTNYREDASPAIRRPGDPKGTRNADAARNGALKMNFDIGRYLKTLFGSLGWDPSTDPELNRPVPPTGTPVSGRQPEGADSIAVVVADTTKSSRPGAGYALKRLGRMVTEIRRINMNFTQRSASNYTRIADRPSWEYQLGVTPSSGVPGYDTPERLTRSLGMSFDTAVPITRTMDVQGRYQRNTSDSDFRSSRSRSLSVTWPDLQFSWKELERFALFRRWFASAQANLNFKIFKSESGRPNEEPDNTRQDFQLAPSMNLGWKNELNTNATVSYNKGTNEAGTSGSETTNLSVALDFRRTIRGGSGFKLPIPGFRKEVNWSSTLDTQLSITYARQGGNRYQIGSDFSEPIPKTTTLSIAPNLRYNFTNSLNGSLFLNYGRSFNEATAQTVTTVRLGVNVVFTF